MSPSPSVASSTVSALTALTGRHGAAVETAGQLAVRARAQRGSEHGPVISVDSVWAGLLPGQGLERGHVCACRGDAAVSTMLSLVAHASRQGSWVALVDMSRIGLLAAHEHGVALERTVCVDTTSVADWAQVIGAIVDGVEIVALSAPRCSSADARRIVARARAQGSVLLVIGDPGPFVPDLLVCTRTVSWEFDTHAAARTVQVQIGGRRVHAPRTTEILLPSHSGRVAHA